MLLQNTGKSQINSKFAKEIKKGGKIYFKQLFKLWTLFLWQLVKCIVSTCQGIRNYRQALPWNVKKTISQNILIFSYILRTTKQAFFWTSSKANISITKEIGSSYGKTKFFQAPQTYFIVWFYLQNKECFLVLNALLKKFPLRLN